MGNFNRHLHRHMWEQTVLHGRRTRQWFSSVLGTFQFRWRALKVRGGDPSVSPTGAGLVDLHFAIQLPPAELGGGNI